MIDDISSEYEIRIQKVKNLNKKNIYAWPNAEDITLKANNIKNISEENYINIYKAAGRIIGKREHGKSLFITIKDDTGILQGYIKNNEINIELFNLISHFFDSGDYILLEGPLFKTKTGEITIRINNSILLSKCLMPIPDEHVGLSDIETRYRQRSVDLLVNKNVKETFIKRSNIIKYIRSYFDENGYLEVETPMLHPIPGGAAARPFITHHNALGTDFFLRIAPELYLKRLVVGGFEKVYEINRNFRNEGVSIRHNPEFTMLEFYTAHYNYTWAMNFVEELMKTVIKKTCKNLILKFNDNDIDFSKPFDRISAYESLLKYTEFSKEALSEKNIDSIFKNHFIKVEHGNLQSVSYNKKIFLLFEEFVEKQLIQPTFLIDFPIELSPLAKRDKDRHNIACRFELFIAGMEISNGFNELNDPFDQSDRFKEQVTERIAGNDEAMYFDDEYIKALEYGLPPTVGVGIGIDRFVMLLTGEKSIKDVILFPSMKRRNN